MSQGLRLAQRNDIAKSGAPAYHRHMEPTEPPEVLHGQMQELRIEHRDLDEVIARLAATPPGDELLMRRLKKRKLQIKDRIALIERMLEPDIPA